MSEPVTITSKQVARGLDLPLEKIESVIKLLDEGFPVPFIARYRKDQTGNLDETHIREIERRLAELRQLAERKQAILKAIESLGKLTPELDLKIREAKTPKRLEDLYLPYKPKRETLASTARSRGLEPLAFEIFEAKLTQEKLDTRVKDFVNADKGVKTEADALLGAGHIIGEMFSEKVELRQKLRDIIQRSSKLVSKRIEQEQSAAETAASESPIVVTGSAQSAAATAIAASFVIEDTAKEDPGKTTASDLQTSKPQPVQATDHPEKETNPVENIATTTETTAETAAETIDTNDMVGDAAKMEQEPVTQETATQETATQETATQETGDTAKDAIVPPAIATAKAVKAEKKKKKKKGKVTPQEEKRLAELEKLYNDYFDFTSDIRRLMPYRVLAINRGEKAKVLRIRFEHDKEAIQAAVNEFCVPVEHPLASFLSECAKDALQRLLLPALEREARRDLTESAEQQAVSVFAKNLRNLLLQPPLNRQRVLALDPGLRHGCKTVALDEFGNVLAYETVYLVGKNAKKEAAAETIVRLIDQYKLTVIAIGNGTGCRETENFVVRLIGDQLAGKGIGYIIVNESGASIYSASPAAKEEFPNYDVMLRGAVSIGRRLQDPLNELVKIEPGHLGVGMYQHDVKAKHLLDSLERVVESCVNHTGVDLNRATPAILRYVAGLNQLTAKRIYEYRQQNGPFRTREQLKQVTGLGEVAFTHSAGFLKIKDGANPFDATWIHPESYDVAAKILQKFGFSDDDLRSNDKIAQISETLKSADVETLAQELLVGPHTVRDIVAQLGRPGRDPREELPPPVFKTGILRLEDLSPGTELTGTVLNVVDFGAFVDIGLHESGLVHISQMADRYVKDAHDLVSVGDVVRVWVVEIDQQRKRISLTMLAPGTERKTERRDERRPPRGEQRGDTRTEGHNDVIGSERRHDRRNDSRDRPQRQGEPGAVLSPPDGNQQGGVDANHRPPRDRQRDGDRRDQRQQDQRQHDSHRQNDRSRQAGAASQSRIAGAQEHSARERNAGERGTGERGRRPESGGVSGGDRRDRPGGGFRGDNWRDGDRRDGGRHGNDRRDSGRSTDRFSRNKSFEMPSKKEKMIVPLSETMKKGAEPLRSFSDLAQFLGRVTPVDPKEEKRRKKEEERLARQRAAEKNAEETVEQMQTEPAVETSPVLEASHEVSAEVPTEETSTDA
ncbi:MAG: helix-hairpin-helix domain-containing protein [Planctomycetaceae bacterium]|nr:helix-hairpin-helix domain-containing protein [Planctomycetaceae bacterium]